MGRRENARINKGGIPEKGDAKGVCGCTKPSP
jgi:hypothetical protein